MDDKQSTPEIIGKRITEARTTRQWSIGELARRSGVDRTAIGRIERGEYAPSIDSLTALARALKVSPNELLGMSRRKALTAPLPTFQLYLRTKYQELPPSAAKDLEHHFKLLAEKHGVKGYGPQPSEDEF